MAQGELRAMFSSDVGISVTGVAGPGVEESTDKQGDVWLAWDIRGCISTKYLQITGDRQTIRSRASIQAIVELCNLLRDK